MISINVPTPENVIPEVQVLFEQLRKQSGKLPNLYAVIGHSPAALRGFMAFEEALTRTSFSGKEKEAIALVVSEVNECDYCLAAHSLVASKRGLSEAEIFNARRGRQSDARFHTAIQLAQAITVNKGHADQKLLEDFFAAGYNEAALIELVALIAVRIFTNYVFAMTHVPVDFPPAPPLTASDSTLAGDSRK